MEKSLYLVPWIEVEYGWGDRPEGYKVFNNLEECIQTTNKDSNNGNYAGGYCGPERPLMYCETPYNEDIASKMFINKLPKFKSDWVYIR